MIMLGEVRKYLEQCVKGVFVDSYGHTYNRTSPVRVIHRRLGVVRAAGFNNDYVIVRIGPHYKYGFENEAIGPGKYLYVDPYDIIKKAGCMLEGE